MKLIENKNAISENRISLGDLINIPLSTIDKSDKDYDKKSLEICHAGKFLMLLNSDLEIDQVREKPDFILKFKNDLIGLEHEILVDPVSKKTEGSFKDLVKSVEKSFQSNHPNEKIHVNVFVNPDFRFRKNEKTILVERLLKMIENKVYRDSFIENDLVRRISWSIHSCLHFSCNLGAWIQKSLRPEYLIESIKRKEKKVKHYISTTGIDKQWLLIVIGSLGESSYEMDTRLDNVLAIKSSFEKIFLMEDFNSRLYEIK
jgi:hypothetical protein